MAAAAGGKVVYAGNELQGYGELVLISHPGNWVTAYAHNNRLLVAEGDTVAKGDQIAEAYRVHARASRTESGGGWSSGGVGSSSGVSSDTAEDASSSFGTTV